MENADEIDDYKSIFEELLDTSETVYRHGLSYCLSKFSLFRECMNDYIMKSN